MGTASVIAICVTLLMMCGGVLTFAYVAVDRLAKVIEEVDYDGMYEDEDTPAALEYALGDVEAVNQQIGTISSIEVNSELTYDVKGDNPEYYYNVSGDRGTMVVAAWFDEDEESERWFERIAIVTDEGELIENLSVRAVPFDSTMSKSVWEQLEHCPELVAEIGEVQYVASDWDSEIEDYDDDVVSFFEVRGTGGSERIKVRYADFDYGQIESIVLTRDDGSESPLTLGQSDGTAGQE